MDDIDKAYHRQYYAAHRFEILARRAVLRWEKKHQYKPLPDSTIYGIPEDVVRQMLTLNLENEEKNRKENI